MKARKTRPVLPAPAPAAGGEAERSAPEVVAPVATSTSEPELLPITSRAPKCHVPVLAYESALADPVPARRMPEGWWIRDDDESRLGWDPVAFRQAD